MILKTVYHMNLLDFRNFLLKFVLRNLFSHRFKSLKNNSCLSSHVFDNDKRERCPKMRVIFSAENLFT